jgi:hypothetical protein
MERATSVTPVDLGVEDRRKFEMFVSVYDFDGARWRLFRANVREGFWKPDPVRRAGGLLDDFVGAKMRLGELFRGSCRGNKLG